MNLTRVECKVLIKDIEGATPLGLNLTRVECKVILVLPMLSVAGQFESYQSGM